MSWEDVSCWIEGHPGLAVWLQAIGVLGSIWIAWAIARSQAKKIEDADRKRDRAKCAAVIGVLSHAKKVIESNLEMSNNPEKNVAFLAEVSRILSVLGGVDLFSLPNATLVNALCVVRQKFESVDFELRDSTNHGMIWVYFKRRIGQPTIKVLEEEIARCQMAMSLI